jgi:hypothetical protein
MSAVRVKVIVILENSSSPQAKVRPNQSFGQMELRPLYARCVSIEHFDRVQLPVADT